MMASLYLGDTAPTAPLASPLYGELAGLPPLLLQVGTREALLDDARRFAAKAREAGVDVGLIEHADVIHMWVVFGPDIPESVMAFDHAGEFVRRVIAL
jgi:epsilon-lactone hydrolase